MPEFFHSLSVETAGSREIRTPEARPEAPRLSQRRWRLWAASLLATLLFGALAWTVAARRETGSQREGNRVAVVGFRNLSPQGRADWIGTALSEMLAADLGSGGSLRLTPSDDVAGMRRDLGLRLDGPLGPGELAQIRRNLGSDWVIVGSFLELPGQDPPLRVDAMLRRTSTGETRVTLSRRGRETELFTLADALAEDLNRALGVPVRGAGQTEAGALVAMPSTPQAQSLYAEGLALLQRRDAQAAAQRLEAATATEPGFYGAWLALAQADELLGFEQQASEASLKAAERSAALPERQRLAVEATCLRIARRWPDAIDRLRRLQALPRHTFEDGLALGETQFQAGQAKEALATIGELRRAYPEASDDARLDQLETRTLNRLEEFPRAKAAAARTVAAARRHGMLRIEVDALHRLAALTLRAGSQADCREALDEAAGARRKAEQTGDRFLLGGVLQDQGVMFGSCDLPDKAEQVYREAISLYREIGAAGKLPALLYNLGTSRLAQGDLLEADSLMREALETCEAHGVLCREHFLHPVGVNRLHRGELAEARKLIEEGLRLNREAGNRYRTAESQSFLTDLAFWSGDPAQAVEIQRQVLALRQELGVANGIAWAHSDLADWLSEAGRGAEALAEARQAMPLAEQDGEVTLKACAHASLALAELTTGDLAAADRESATALAQLSPPRSPFASFFIWRVRAKVLLARGQLDPAAALIDQGLDLARRNGFVTYELWGRLLRAQLAQARGQTAEARRLANDLATEARAKRFGSVAQRCDLLLRGGQGRDVRARAWRPRDREVDRAAAWRSDRPARRWSGSTSPRAGRTPCPSHRAGDTLRWRDSARPEPSLSEPVRAQATRAEPPRERRGRSRRAACRGQRETTIPSPEP